MARPLRIEDAERFAWRRHAYCMMTNRGHRVYLADGQTMKAIASRFGVHTAAVS